MFGVGVGVRIGGRTAVGGGFDADAQAFFDRVTAAGGTLSTTEKNATNQLVLDMKSAGIWSSMKAIYPMVGASAAACAQNLKSSSFTGTFSSGWTFASTGVTPNGTSAYMNTNFLESTNLTLNSQHISVYTRTNISGLMCDIGAETPGGSQSNIYSNFSNGFYPRVQAGNGGTPINLVTQGLFMANRVNSTDVQGWKNTTKYTITNASVALNLFTLYIGAVNNTGSASNFSPRQNAFASIGDGLTDTQASNFYTAVQAFQTTLSRQV